MELSVVLTIIGITLAGAIELATNKTEADRVTETNARLDIIEEALKVYVINNQRLPCPANASASLSLDIAGKEGASDATECEMSSSTTTIGANYTSGGIYSGAIPTKTLHIPDKNMADDWDRRFTYVVDYRFANNEADTNSDCDGTVSTICFKYTTDGGITINDSTGAARTAVAVYTIISHGKNGYGAFNYTGGVQLDQPAAPDASEVSNAATSSGTLDATFVQKDSTTTFDDIVRYKEKSLIISDVNGVTDSTTCFAAYDAFTTPGTLTDPCPGATSTANCYALATQINNFCLQP